MIKGLLLQFILMPLIALALSFPLIIIRKKNELLNNKTLVVFILVFAIVVASAGVSGFLANNFSPWGYLSVQLFFCVAGIFFIQFYQHFLQKKITAYKEVAQWLVALPILVLGGYLFTIVFNFCSDVNNGYIAMTSVFIFLVPLLFYKTYMAFISIPFEIYSVWTYPETSADVNLEGLNFNSFMVLEIEFFRQMNDSDKMRLKAKAPEDITLGTWFKKLIDDYNVKYPVANITYKNNEEALYGWVFYFKRSFFHKGRLLDPDRTIRENDIAENVAIVAKRVMEYVER